MKQDQPRYAPQLTRKQRREKIATHLLGSLIAGRENVGENRRRWINLSVELADQLMERLDKPTLEEEEGLGK